MCKLVVKKAVVLLYLNGRDNKLVLSFNTLFLWKDEKRVGWALVIHPKIFIACQTFVQPWRWYNYLSCFSNGTSVRQFLLKHERNSMFPSAPFNGDSIQPWHVKPWLSTPAMTFPITWKKKYYLRTFLGEIMLIGLIRSVWITLFFLER